MLDLGWLYENGRGVAQDYVRAREWYEKAAAKDNASAMFNLALLYENGQSVTQDYAKAREWYEKAATKDNTRRPPPRTTRSPCSTSACFTPTVGAWRRTTSGRASGTRRPPPRTTRAPWSTSACFTPTVRA